METRTNPLFLALAAGLGLMLAGPVYGISSTWTWDGSGADNLWMNPTNWLPFTGGFPHTGDNVQFGGNVQLNPFNNNSGLEVSEIVFNAGSGAFTLNGNAISVGGAGGIVNNSAATQTIAMGVTLTAIQTFKATSGPLVFSTIDGNYSLTLSGSNPFTLTAPVGGGTALAALGVVAPITITGGSVVTKGNQVYNSSGTLTLGGDTLLQTTSGAITVGPVVGNGNSFTVMASSGSAALTDATGIGTLNLTASQATLSGTISSTSSQAYTVTGTGALTLAGNTSMQGTGTGAIITVGGGDHGQRLQPDGHNARCGLLE